MTREDRLQQAIQAVKAHKAVYYSNGEYRGADFWDFAEIFEIIDDLYEVTGDKSLFVMFEEMYDFVIRRYTADWKDNPFNDDIMWLVIAFTRAYLYTGNQSIWILPYPTFRTPFSAPKATIWAAVCSGELKTRPRTPA